MIISDLEHLEVVSEANSVKGGIAFANASAIAFAESPNVSVTFASTAAFVVSLSFSLFTSGR